MRLGYIIASNEVMLLRKPIGYVYREKPGNEEDSGWRVFSGEETQEYANDAENFAMYNASTVVEAHPEIAALLNRAFPVAFERDATSGVFVEVAADREGEE